MTQADFLRKLLIVAALAACSDLPMRGVPSVLAGPGDEPPATVEWAGHAFREVTKLTDLPLAIQRVLGVGNTGLGGVAERDGSYNSTDMINMKLPTRRFAVAGVTVAGAEKVGVSVGGADKADGVKPGADKASAGKADANKRGLDDDTALVALEQGGIAWRVVVMLYSNVQSKPVVARTWTIFTAPKTLRELVDQIDSQLNSATSKPERK